MQHRLEEKASLSFVRQALDNKLDRFEWETYRTEVATRLATISLLEKRAADLDSYVRASESRLESMMADVARKEIARSAGEAAQDSLVAVSRRMELLQSELCRLARVVDSKADGQEVEAALKLKASKTSVQKRLMAAAEEDESIKETLRKLKTRVESVEGTAEGMGRRAAEQEAALRRVTLDVEGLLHRANRPRPAEEGHGAGAPSSSSSLALHPRNVEGLAHQAAKKAAKLEKDMAVAAEKLRMLEEELSERPTRAMVEEVNRVVNEGLKGLEDEIFKELDSRDEELKHRDEETATYVKELEMKVKASGEQLNMRADGPKGAMRHEGGNSIEQRLVRVEARCELLTPERLGSLVRAALGDVEAGKLLELARAKGGREHNSSSPSFKEVLRRLDSLDFDFAHAGMLFKVLQEVVCDALGALEGNMLQQMSVWAQESQRKGEEVTKRLGTLETKLGATDVIVTKAEEVNVERILALVRQELKQQHLQPPQEATGAGEASAASSTDLRELVRDASHSDEKEDEEASAAAGASNSDRRPVSTKSRTGSGPASRMSSGSTAGGQQRRDHSRTPTPSRSVLASIAEASETTRRSNSMVSSGSRGFQEIVLRRLDHVEKEMERMHEEQHKRRVTDGAKGKREAADKKRGEGPSSKEQLAEGSSDAAAAARTMEPRLAKLESQVRDLRLDLNQEATALADRIQSLADGMEKLRQEAEADGLLNNGGQHKSEAMRRLEEQVLACQEQIQSRMSSFRTRMEQQAPAIQGFAQAVSAMSGDLTGEAASRKRGSTALDALGAALESRIRQLESESSLLSRQLHQVTSDLFTVNREVERLVAVSPVPLPPLPPSQYPPPQAAALANQEMAPSGGNNSRWRSGGAPQDVEEGERQQVGMLGGEDYDNASQHTLQRMPVEQEPAYHRQVSVASQAQQGLPLHRGDESAFEQHRQQQDSVARSQAQQAWASVQEYPSVADSRRQHDPRGEREGAEEDLEQRSRRRRSQPGPTSSYVGSHHQARSMSVVSDVTMASMGPPGAERERGARPPPRGGCYSRASSYVTAKEGGGGRGGDLIREEDEEIRTASSAAEKQQQQQQQQYPRLMSAQSHIGSVASQGQLMASSAPLARPAPRGGGGLSANNNQGQAVSSPREEGSVLTGRSVTTMVTAVSSQEQEQLEAIRREKERLASLIPQLHST